MTCPLCTNNAGEHDLARTCCRVRFLLALPSTERYRATRAGWIDRWRREYGDAAADETQAAAAAAWERRRADARAQLAAVREQLGRTAA